MAALRGNAGLGFRALAPEGQVLGEPRFRWVPHPDAWLYRIELFDTAGRQVARGWSGQHEMPLAWLRDEAGAAPLLRAGDGYRWRVYAYKDGPDGDPCAAAPEARFVFLGPVLGIPAHAGPLAAEEGQEDHQEQPQGEQEDPQPQETTRVGQSDTEATS